MNKQLILDAIKASAKDRVPPGVRRFASETGIKEHQWQKYWPRWGDALQEAGFSPNQFAEAYDETRLIEALIQFVREIRRFPTLGDHRVKSHSAANFPSHASFG